MCGASEVSAGVAVQGGEGGGTASGMGLVPGGVSALNVSVIEVSGVAAPRVSGPPRGSGTPAGTAMVTARGCVWSVPAGVTPAARVTGVVPSCETKCASCNRTVPAVPDGSQQAEFTVLL